MTAILIFAILCFAFAALMAYSIIVDGKRRERAARIAHAEFLAKYAGRES